ncbi:MAG: alkyl hydroperoxide reductase [Bacteroidetes bacterium]|nr:MAG: alkyl hydroperoxide reductase [Bacteroidota bacterium]
MKPLLRFAGYFMLLSLLTACNPKGLVIEGEIANAANLQVFVDEVRLGKASNVLNKADLGADGSFKLSFEDGLPAGIYNLRIGAKRVNLVFDGSEKQVKLTGNLENLQNYELTVNGSGDSHTLVKVMQGLFRREYKPEDIMAFVDTVKNPHLGVFVAYTALGQNAQFINIQQKAAEKLNSAYPDSEAATAYMTYLANLQQQAQAQAAQAGGGLIQVGMPAPDIRMKSPNGKEYALSELRGKVVLLDFWASWCGPCRRENPSVVEVYNRYKSQGFTVFSVSLDGLDSRSMARYQPGDVDRALEGQKQRWVEAINQDGLAWEYHVSDLKKWESTAGQSYGVSSIPRTFLIDREGNIAAVNLRGAAAIEQALKQAL